MHSAKITKKAKPTWELLTLATRIGVHLTEATKLES